DVATALAQEISTINSIGVSGSVSNDTTITLTATTAGDTNNGALATALDGTTFTASAHKDGAPLELQIGDTSDTFNQLSVSIDDMHAANLKDENGTSIADIRIDTQTDAQAAVSVIKAAINQVSGV